MQCSRPGRDISISGKIVQHLGTANILGKADQPSIISGSAAKVLQLEDNSDDLGNCLLRIGSTDAVVEAAAVQVVELNRAARIHRRRVREFGRLWFCRRRSETRYAKVFQKGQTLRCAVLRLLQILSPAFTDRGGSPGPWGISASTAAFRNNPGV